MSQVLQQPLPLEVPARTPAGERARHLALSGHVPVLDAVRGIAIAMVLLVHLTPSGQGQSAIGAVVKLIAASGKTGVDLFFVLSGFLITGILLDAKGSSHYFRNFYARRTLRIFPLYYGTLLVVFILIPLIHPLSGDALRVAHKQGWLWFYGANFQTARGGSYFGGAFYPFSGGWITMDHFWSLAVEEHFYLVWPLAIFLLSRRAAIGFCALVIGVAFWLRWEIYRRGLDTMAYYHFTPCRMDQLAIGALLAVLAREVKDQRLISRFAMVAAPVALGVLCWKWNTEMETVVYGHTLFAVLYASVITLLLTCSARNPAMRAVDNRGLRLMGKYSYAIYVLHPLVIHAGMRRVTYQSLGKAVHSGMIGVFLYIAMGFVLSIAAGWASWHLYEKHFLKLKRFFEYRKPV